VARVAFSPDGQLLAAATEDRTAQLWDVAGGKLLANLEGDLLRFHCVTFSPDGRLVLAGGGDWKPDGVNQVTVWDVAGRNQVRKLTGHKSAVLVISYSPDGKVIATGSADGTIRLWDADSGKHLKTLSGHKGMVEAAVFTADGRTLVSGGQDATVRFWDVEQGTEKSQFPMPGVVRSVRFTPDAETLIVGSGPKTLKLFAAANQKELAALWNGADPQPVAMDLFPITSPTPRPREKSWLAATGLLGLGLASIVSLSFAVGLTLRHRRAGQPPAGAGTAAALLTFACAECGKRLRVKPELAGKKVRCPRCNKATSVPANSPTEGPVPPPRRWWAHADALAAAAAAVLLAAGAVVGLWLLPGEEKAPSVSRLQVVADRVRAQKSDSIDARPYPSLADRDLAVLQGLTHLKNLNLDNTEVTDEGMKDVAQAANLVSLSLTNTQVSDAGLAHLRPLTNLDDLRLDKLPITDAGLAHVGDFSRLRKLSLYQTHISDAGLTHLKSLSNLERLSLDETSIGDEGLRQLSSCFRLKYLSVWHTRVTPAGVQELTGTLPGLKVNR
jgi:hypothetical protein